MSDLEDAVESALNECVARFVYCLRQNGAIGLGAAAVKALKDRFRPWFTLMMQGDPDGIWAANRDWVLLQTCRMAGFAARYMSKDGRTIPTEEHLDQAVSDIQTVACNKPAVGEEGWVLLGGWCGS